MFRTTILVRALVVSMLWMVACERHEAVDVAAPEPEPVPDVVDNDGDTEGYAYLPGNAFHERQMKKLLKREDVAAAVDAFAASGLRLSPDKSITVRGGDKDCFVWATMIALQGGERSAIIACYGSGERFGMAPVQFSAYEPPGQAGWQPFVGSGWFLVPDTGNLPRVPQRWEPFEWWDWGYFGRCMANRAPEVAVACAFQCVWIPGYWHCFMACTAAEAVGATIACVLDMYQWGGDKIKKDE